MKISNVGNRFSRCSLFLAAGLSAATMKFEVTPLGTLVLGGATPGGPGATVEMQRCTYFLSGITLLADQEVNIRFDPAVYGALSNPHAGPGFDVLLFQPNQPPGAFGDFSALSMSDQ